MILPSVLRCRDVCLRHSVKRSTRNLGFFGQTTSQVMGVKLGRHSVARFHKIGAFRPSIHIVVSVPPGVMVVKLFVSRGAVNLSVIKLESVYPQGRVIRRMTVEPCAWAAGRFAPRQGHNILNVSLA